MASQIVQCTTACEVTLLVEPAPVNDERLKDYGQLFLLLLGAVVIVGLMKALVRLFTGDMER